MKAAAYLRVSTDLQDARAQRTAIERYAAEKGFELLAIFSDEDVSGSTDFFSRRGVSEMLEFCEREGVGHVIFYDLTRVGRFEEPERIFDVLKALSDRGIIAHFVSEPEIADPLLKKFWDFLKSWFATYEKLMIAQRTRYGIEKLRAQGRLYHRPSLEHYYAAWLHSKPLREVSSSEVRAANQALRTLLRRAVREGVKKKYLLAHLASRELAGLYERFPNAPRTYWAARHLLSDGERL